MSLKKNNKKLFMTVAIIWVVSFILFAIAYVVLLLPQKKSKEQNEK
jgi:uncharacterized protein involved in response to NO